MFAHRLLIPSVALFFSTAALADSPAPTATPANPPAATQTHTSAAAATANAAMHATGRVKSINAAQNQVVVTVGGADRTFSFANLAHSPLIKVGSQVDVTYNGTTASAITLHK